MPCERCRRYGRTCLPADPVSKSTTPPTSNANGNSSENQRIAYLETIARHFLGDVSLETGRLREVVDVLESEDVQSPHAQDSNSATGDAEDVTLDEERFTVEPVSQGTAHYSGEFSTWNFSQRVLFQADKRLRDAKSTKVNEHFNLVEHWRPSYLNLRDVHVRSVMQNLPPKHIASFLVQIYFQHAQTTSFFVEREWLMTRLDDLYNTVPKTKSRAEDASWICTVLCVLAVGTQFAHLDQTDAATAFFDGKTGSGSAIDALGVSCYHLAADLIPGVLTIASIESVQACLMLAHYTLPLDTQGLAFTYLGLALKMAIVNGIHRKDSGSGMDDATVNLRNRLWWTTYKLEKRISVLHGRPRSIACVDFDAEYPLDHGPGLDAADATRILENISIKMTDWLGDLAFLIHMLRKSPRGLRRAYFDRLLRVRQQYLDWWARTALPKVDRVQHRSVVQLRLSHHLTLVFLGRSFMLGDAAKLHTSNLKDTAITTGRNASIESKRWDLVQGAITSAVQIISLCHDLHESIRLAKNSYIEFTACRAAILVLLARSLQQSSTEYRSKLDQGLRLVEYMATANASTESDASLLLAVGAALQLLEVKHNPIPGGAPASNVGEDPRQAEVTLESFKEWAAGQQPQAGRDHGGAGGLAAPEPHIDFGGASMPFEEFGWDTLDASFFGGESFDMGGMDTQSLDEAFELAYRDFCLPSMTNRLR